MKLSITTRLVLVAGASTVLASLYEAASAGTLGLGWTGLDGDRQYAFHKPTAPSRFPWFTARIHAEMVLYTARYGHADTKTAPVTVTAPRGPNTSVTIPSGASTGSP